MEHEICRKVAELYAGADWHRLSLKQRAIVKMLEEVGYIRPNNPENGFVGRAAPFSFSLK